MVPAMGLYLSAQQRSGWRPVVFFEPPEDANMMTVLSVCIIPKGSNFDFASAAGARLATLELDDVLDVHVVATHHRDTTWTTLEPVRRTLASSSGYDAPETLYPDSVLLFYGKSDDGVRFLLPCPSRDLVPT
jgi:hypothetical protein